MLSITLLVVDNKQEIAEVSRYMYIHCSYVATVQTLLFVGQNFTNSADICENKVVNF